MCPYKYRKPLGLKTPGNRKQLEGVPKISHGFVKCPGEAEDKPLRLVCQLIIPAAGKSRRVTASDTA